MDGKRRKKNKHETKKGLTINFIQSLGGTKEDLSLIEDVDNDSNDSDFENPDEDFDADPINKYELRDFIEKLELYKHRPGIDEDDSEADDNDTKETETTTKAKKSKKSKKKTNADDSDEVEKDSQELLQDEDLNVSKKLDTVSDTDEAKQPGKTKKERNKYKSLVQHNEVSSTTKDSSQNYKTHMTKYRTRKYLLVKSGADYFDQQKEASCERNKLSDDLIRQMENFAAKLLEDEVKIYNGQKENAKRSNVGWMKTVLASGTLADKIAALTVLVQESPVHSIAHIDTLLAMTKKHVKRESMQAADALKELFLTQLVPDDRKLLPFSQRPLSELYSMVSGNKDTLDKKLVLWYFEGQLKERYSLFVKSLQEMSHNPLVAIRTKAVSTINQLLIHKPEEEKTLLTLLLNKIGDPHYKLASTVTYSLLQLVEKHPNMKDVVVREVEYLLFRPNISPGAQYYSVCFLNQLKLSRFEKDLAIKLIKIYFAFFKANMKKGEVDSKMMSALLSGVNRAYPYAELEEDFLSGQIDNLYKLVHIVNFSTSVQALSLLYQVMDTSKVVSDRYYTALYKKLADPALKSASKPALFLNLLYKSIRADELDRRKRAFIKRLLQVLFYQQTQFICGSLILISEILRVCPGLLTVSSKEGESLDDDDDDDDEEIFIDQPDPDSDNEGIKQEMDEDEHKDLDIKKEKNNQAPASWIHRKNCNYKSERGSYDPFHRNPLFCHAEKECMWELEKLTRHYHPSVSLFANQLLKGERIQYDGNPLLDFTIIRFLDRFVFKNPKKDVNQQKRIATLDRIKYTPVGLKKVKVDSDDFLKMDEKKIPVDDLFYHRYFTRKAQIKKKREAEESSDVDDDEFDAYLDRFEKNYDEGELALGYDFASEFEKKTGKKTVESSSDEEDEDDVESVTLGGEELMEALSDEEEEFDDEEFTDALKDKMEGLMDDGIDDDDEEEEDGDDEMPFDEEAVSFSEDEERVKTVEMLYARDELKELRPKGKSNKRKAPPSKGKDSKKRGRKSANSELAMAAAEEFGDLMDENAGSLIDMTGSGAMSTADKAGAKQLKWEMERDRWLRGESWKQRKLTKNRKKQGFKGPAGKPSWRR